ncbi:MAG: hypothetical protein ACFHHU_13315 [Porticoccaceae bacterium]
MSHSGTTATIVRWVLLIPAVLLTFYFWLATAIGSYLIAEQFCPEDLIVSNVCYAPYMSRLKEILLLLFPAIAAGCMVLVAALIAPRRKTFAALATFVLGSVFAVYQAFDAGYWATFALSEIVALLALIRVYRKYRLKS